MASKTADPATVFTDAFIAGVKQTQELAFSGVTAWAELAGKGFTMPEMGSLPFVDAMPTPQQMVETTFGFAEELLSTQKDFAIKLLGAVSPGKPA
ncbi:MAG TPA: hypothetical protein VGA62_11845 [Acidimicrobiia bacterium]